MVMFQLVAVAVTPAIADDDISIFMQPLFRPQVNWDHLKLGGMGSHSRGSIRELRMKAISPEAPMPSVARPGGPSGSQRLQLLAGLSAAALLLKAQEVLD